MDQLRSALTEPMAVHRGLAVYAAGEGPAILLMPAPHACTVAPEIDKPLSRLLQGLGLRVVSFDPPGAFRSRRAAYVGMPEILGCAAEAVEVAGARAPVDVCGHLPRLQRRRRAAQDGPLR